MKFIKLTERACDEPTYFNLTYILSFHSNASNFTTIHFSMDSDVPNVVQVKESPEQILKLIKEVESE